ncbi:MAG: DNA alkylation repair protein [Acidobacteriota bacterium]|jgi:3-methyladenine DNA glycosylase AlkD|nr:DNA alkylation repair protein [Acidobacteriota bacterium]
MTQAQTRQSDASPDASTANAAETVRAELRALIDPEKAVVLPRFFKTGPGQYGEGDRFHGVVVPKIRKVALAHAEASEAEIVALLDSEYHEERMVALLILIEQYRRGDAARQEAIFRLYLASTGRINNWDLVDLSAPQIVGAHIYNNSKFDNDGEPVSTGVALLTKLSASPSLWERRIAIIATLYFIRRGNCRETFRIAQRLLGDEHDLIHKAVGWMLREAGKHCSMAGECAFLDRHATAMPRTMLRYAIERFPENLRRHYLKGTSKKPADKARRSEKSGVYTW